MCLRKVCSTETRRESIRGFCFKKISRLQNFVKRWLQNFNDCDVTLNFNDCDVTLNKSYAVDRPPSDSALTWAQVQSCAFVF